MFDQNFEAQQKQWEKENEDFHNQLLNDYDVEADDTYDDGIYQMTEEEKEIERIAFLIITISLIVMACAFISVLLL